MKQLITKWLNFRNRRKQQQYSQLLHRRLNLHQRQSYQPQQLRYGTGRSLSSIKVILLFGIIGIFGMIIAAQQFQIYQLDNYVVELQSVPSPTPQPTYTPQPISIIIATPIVEITSTSTIQIQPTVSQAIQPTITLEPPLPVTELPDVGSVALVEIEPPVYDFDNGASTGGIITNNDVFLPPDKSDIPQLTNPVSSSEMQSNATGDLDMAFLYNFIIALLNQLGILQLLSANIQLVIIVGIAFLLLALFIR